MMTDAQFPYLTYVPASTDASGGSFKDAPTSHGGTILMWILVKFIAVKYVTLLKASFQHLPSSGTVDTDGMLLAGIIIRGLLAHCYHH